MALNNNQRNRVEELRRRRWEARSQRTAERAEREEAQQEITVDFETPPTLPRRGDNREVNHPQFTQIETENISLPVGSPRPVGWWQMRNFRWIRMEEMSDSHLNNCIRMIQRASVNGRARNPIVLTELLQEQNRREQTRIAAENASRMIAEMRTSRERQREWDQPAPPAENRWRAQEWFYAGANPNTEEPEPAPVVDLDAPRRIKI